MEDARRNMQYRRRGIPAFGEWNYDHGLDGGDDWSVLTQRFESATMRIPFPVLKPCREINEMSAQFKSIDHYKKVQSALLIEEVRARVHLGIKKIQKAEFYDVISVLDVDSSEHLFVDIDLAMLPVHGFNHSAKDGDIFLLTMQPPADIELDDSCWLGIAVEFGADNSFQKSFRMLVSKKHDRSLVKAVKFVSFLTNITDELNFR